MSNLGRRNAPDTRDLAHPMMLTAPVTKTTKHWTAAKILDQGAIGACVGYGCDQWWRGAPRIHVVSKADPLGIYNAAQLIDEFTDTPPQEGTSVRAGVKVLQDRGHITAYQWAFDLQTTINFVLSSGPVILGTNWYMSMFNPDPSGLIKILPNSAVAGGHCYVLDGVNMRTNLARCRNSWGTGWGQQGRFFISLNDLERLILEEGEVCVGVE